MVPARLSHLDRCTDMKRKLAIALIFFVSACGVDDPSGGCKSPHGCIYDTDCPQSDCGTSVCEERRCIWTPTPKLAGYACLTDSPYGGTEYGVCTECGCVTTD